MLTLFQEIAEECVATFCAIRSPSREFAESRPFELRLATTSLVKVFLSGNRAWAAKKIMLKSRVREMNIKEKDWGFIFLRDRERCSPDCFNRPSITQHVLFGVSGAVLTLVRVVTHGNRENMSCIFFTVQ